MGRECASTIDSNSFYVCAMHRVGKYLCDADADMTNRYAAPPGPTSTEC